MEKELLQLEQELLQAADTWFDQKLHLKLQRLIQIAKLGQVAIKDLAIRHTPSSSHDWDVMPYRPGERGPGMSDF